MVANAHVLCPNISTLMDPLITIKSINQSLLTTVTGRRELRLELIKGLLAGPEASASDRENDADRDGGPE